MKYVLDTNVISALMKGEPRVLARLKKVGRAAVLLPQPALSEIAYGIARLPKSRRKEELSSVYERILQEFQRVTWTDEVSARFGEQKAKTEKRGHRLEDFDLPSRRMHWRKVTFSSRRTASTCSVSKNSKRRTGC